MDIGLVCDECDGFSAFGVTQCGRCGASISLEGAPGPAKAPRKKSETAPGRKTMFFGAMQAARAKLVVIRGDGLDGVSFNLAGQEHIAGREDCDVLFEDDAYLSPHHCNFIYKDNVLTVVDLESANGVFVRVTGTVPIEPGTQVLVGQELLELEPLPDTSQPSAERDGTYYYSTPVTGVGFRILQRLEGGSIGASYCCFASCGVGREGNTINFPDDPFISGKHALFEQKDGKLTVTDLDSKNGTFVRVKQQRPLTHGDYLFMGQQLLRVEIV